jgi:hypothetical protein
MCIETYTNAATKTNTVALNNGATANDSNNNSTSTVSHYNFGWGVTTSNAVPSAVTVTLTTTKLSQVIACLNTFKLPTPIPLISNLQHRRPPAHFRPAQRGRF